jgi:multisubunit Na+/H+ antiporter MnhG subunit
MMYFGDDFCVHAAFSGFNAIWSTALIGLILSGLLAFLTSVVIALVFTLMLAPLLSHMLGA